MLRRGRREQNGYMHRSRPTISCATTGGSQDVGGAVWGFTCVLDNNNNSLLLLQPPLIFILSVAFFYLSSSFLLFHMLPHQKLHAVYSRRPPANRPHNGCFLLTSTSFISLCTFSPLRMPHSPVNFMDIFVSLLHLHLSVMVFFKRRTLVSTSQYAKSIL